MAGVFDDISLNRPLWPHQVRALAALDRDVARGDRATYLVVPPGGGKTLIGLEAARRLGRPTVVLCPNTAIQAQWMAQWQAAFGPDVVRATASRELPTPLTVLTYQALCTLGATGNGEEEAGRLAPGTRLHGDGVLSLMHPNGRALIARLQAGGPWTLVLDECHHLLELWGRLLQAVIGQLGKPRIVGLTATPPHLMTAEQAALHKTLFGAVDLEVSAPALVREGLLAPYQELAFLTRPSPAEADYIGGSSLRFAELRAGLLDPSFASVPFLGWLQARVVERRGTGAPEGAQVSWPRFEKDEPALADAAVRLHVAGLLDLPEGARVREQHRHPPTAADWVALIGDYTQRCLLASEDPRDERALGAIRRALPAVGYRLTRAGVRAGESPVDRVLARSKSKARAAIDILAAESAELGSRLRALVLCDFEDAGGMVPADLAGVLQAGSGGTRLVLETLLADPQTAALDPVLMTGRHVASGPECAERLLKWNPGFSASGSARVAALWGQQGGDLGEIIGPPGWETRRYVPLVTRFHAEGGSRCLIGTRALLGEGWDAPAVNVVIDLTAATTPTSVVQARGRALRLDAAWPGKVADNWGVVCVTGDHPKGAADFDRFARKHDRYFALAQTGDIVSGVAHVDPRLSPYAPPPEEQFDALNATMLRRASERDGARERWAIGTPYADEPVATVTVATRRPLGLPAKAAGSLTRRRRRGRTAAAFERAWNARVGPGTALWTGSPEGTGILAAQRGDDPFALTTQIRTLWR